MSAKANFLTARFFIVLCAICFSSSAAANYTKTKYPIVLVHGISGFDSIANVIDYFYNVPYNLRRSGAKVYVPSVSAFNSSEARGEQLADFLMSLPEQKFNLIGHSQGSPTARVAASIVPQKVASVTSVGGVNGGSKVADIVLGVLPSGVPQSLVSSIANAAGEVINFLSGADQPQNGLASAQTLSTSGTRALNNALGNKGISGNCRSISENMNINGFNIKAFSWSGTSPLTNIFDISDAPIGITRLAFGFERNDGLVSECSSKFGRVIYSRYNMNHLDEVNQLLGLRGFTNPVSLYRAHANRLKGKGL